MTAAILCREMGWTWNELQEQPLWFVRNLIGYLAAESDSLRKQQKK
jgi:hypothetical protein